MSKEGCRAFGAYNDDAVTLAEEAMIEQYYPHVNVRGITYENLLPDR